MEVHSGVIEYTCQSDIVLLCTQGQLCQLLTAIKGLALKDKELRARCSMFL